MDPDAERLVTALEIVGRHALAAAAEIRAQFDTPAPETPTDDDVE
jgi:hypothetical protein